MKATAEDMKAEGSPGPWSEPSEADRSLTEHTENHPDGQGMSGEGPPPEKGGKEEASAGRFRRRSLRVQIGLLYTLLALINITFFSVMIFENQTELLNQNIEYHYRLFIQNVLTELSDYRFGDAKSRQRLVSILAKHRIQDFRVFTEKGLIRLEKPNTGKKEVEQAIRRKTIELSIETSVFKSNYKIVPNTADFSVDFFIPIRSTGGDKLFLHIRTHIDQIKERLLQLYWQIGLSVIWGVIFHIIFGIFVYRVIFRRVGLLTEASDRMATGDLKARANWKLSRKDELDELGSSFNSMAEKIEDTVETISRLNREIQNELEIGRDVQQLFLPEEGVLGDYRVAVHYQPLREVSGDVYNFFNIRDHYRAIFLADASGHGVSAALITAITLMILDEALAETIQPGQVIEHLNKTLSDRLQSSFFATGVFLIFTREGACYFTNAGHNPPLYLRPRTGRLEEIQKCGPPMGMFDEAEYRTMKLQAKSGDKIILYTDSLVESKNAAGEMYSLERVRKLVAENMNRTVEEIVEILRTSLDQFAAEYTDDLTIIVLEIP